MNNALHGTCAVIFFILMLLYTLKLQAILMDIKKVDPSFISKKSMEVKSTICYLYVVGLVAIICAIFSNFFFLSIFSKLNLS